MSDSTIVVEFTPYDTLQSTDVITLGSDTIFGTSTGTGVSRLDALEDVIESNPADNATLVYNASTDKYEVKELDLDGGTF